MTTFFGWKPLSLPRSLCPTRNPKSAPITIESETTKTTLLKSGAVDQPHLMALSD